jgi:hypothetical protein
MDCHVDLSSLRNANCIDRCAGKHVKVNKKVLEIYMEVQPQITKKRMDEMATL